MMRLTQKLKSAITAHALQAYPLECCGVVIDGVYHACQNIAQHNDAFEIDAEEYLALSELGEIQAIVHSHPDGEPLPSEFDKVQMRLHGVPWIITSVNNGETITRLHAVPSEEPLLGRNYYHGVQDCYTLVRDFYRRELGISLPDYQRQDDWWEDENAEPLYEKYFQDAGFHVVDNIHYGDVILCRVGRTHHINHALIYLGDKTLKSEKTPDVIGNNLVLHHPHGRLSVREMYGDTWQKRTALVVRYENN